jgi:hypothetical protein
VKVTVAERQNTAVCYFDPCSPRIAAFDIHDWLHDVLKIPEHIVNTIQIDGTKRQVYIKFIELSYVQALIRDTKGQAEYKHTTGELSIANITNAGMGTKRVSIANLPPEVHNASIRTALAPFGTILRITEEMWSQIYRYPVSNGTRIVSIMLVKHIPS